MRLSPHERQTIKKVVTRFLPDAKAYVFGSRAIKKARGGDIDILVIGSKRAGLHTILRIKIALKQVLGDQKIDLIYQQQGRLTPFAELAKMEGVLL